MGPLWWDSFGQLVSMQAWSMHSATKGYSWCDPMLNLTWRFRAGEDACRTYFLNGFERAEDTIQLQFYCSLLAHSAWLGGPAC